MELINRRDDFSRARGGTRTIRRIGEMSLMHVDGDDRGPRGLREILEPLRQLALRTIHISLHQLSPVAEAFLGDAPSNIQAAYYLQQQQVAARRTGCKATAHRLARR
jgi:hypothetical protein